MAGLAADRRRELCQAGSPIPVACRPGRRPWTSARVCPTPKSFRVCYAQSPRHLRPPATGARSPACKGLTAHRSRQPAVSRSAGTRHETGAKETARLKLFDATHRGRPGPRCLTRPAPAGPDRSRSENAGEGQRQTHVRDRLTSTSRSRTRSRQIMYLARWIGALRLS